MREDKHLLLANKAWAAEQLAENPNFFTRHLEGQTPEFLWIGCSDSRVSPDLITQTHAGGMFIHRNVANLVVEDDLNLMSVLQYAVNVLKVRNIIVCGHYGCGGLIGALKGKLEGPVDRWLEHARAVYREHREEIDAIEDAECKVNRFVEVNVRNQLLKLARTAPVRAAFASGQPLELHGWVYDLRDGLLKPLLEIHADTVLDEVGPPETVLNVVEPLPA